MSELRVWVTVPTYNEVENIEILVRRLRDALPDVHILVVDDNSPDGTAEKTQALAGELGNLEVLQRPRKMGLGSAYRAGHAIGIARGYDVMIQIDADLSHDPADVPRLVAAVERGADLAIGSRYVPGGSVPNWPKRRLALSYWGNRYAAFCLGIDVRDTTAGYRAYRAPMLTKMDFSSTHSTGYGFQIEMTYRVARAGGTIEEVPIAFTDRVRGTSKMSSRIVAEAMFLVTWWGLRDRVLRRGRRARAEPRPVITAESAPPAPTDEDAQPSSRRFFIGLGVITAVALAWRITYDLINRGRIALGGDTSYYHYQANDIAHGKWFVDPFQLRYWGRLTPSAGHPPAYILYLATVSKFIGSSELTHRIASTFLGAGAVFMLGLVARKVFGSDWAGWTAAALAAGYAALYINDEMLMSESMYVLTTAIAVWCAYKFWDRPSVRTAALMGAGIGLAALSRAEAAMLLPILAVPFAFFRREKPWRERLKLAVVACAAGGALLAPWLGYNLTRFDHPVLMSNGVGSVLMVANCDHVSNGQYDGTYHGQYVGYWNIACSFDIGHRLDLAYSPAHAADLKQQLGLLPGTDFAFFGDESTHEVVWRAVGLYEMKRHKQELIGTVALRVARMWDLFRVSQNIRLNGLLEGRGLAASRLALYEYYPLLGFAIGGLVLLRRRKVPILPFLAFAASVTFTAAITFGITRYRAPVDALLPVLAGGAIVWCVEQVRARLGRAEA